jgi:hypothetical protein
MSDKARIRTSYELPELERKFSSLAEEVGYILDQVDELIEAIKSGHLQGVNGMQELLFATQSADTSLHAKLIFEDREAALCDNGDVEASELQAGLPSMLVYDNINLLKYVKEQMEKAAAVFVLIGRPEDAEGQRLYDGCHEQVAEYVEFYHTVCANRSFADAIIETERRNTGRGGYDR